MVQSIVIFLLTAQVGLSQEYLADGNPTAEEEEIRWHVNRGRFDPSSENIRRATTYSDIVASGPLAPDEALTLAARRHSEDMARANILEHETIPSSRYYSYITHPDPWDRMRAEGYTWTDAGENIASGFSTSEGVYVGWWKSEGHRENMYRPALKETGSGRSGLYHAQNLGESRSNHFFTDTIFFDSNGNGGYNQGEDIGNILVRLKVGGQLLRSLLKNPGPATFSWRSR